MNNNDINVIAILSCLGAIFGIICIVLIIVGYTNKTEYDSYKMDICGIISIKETTNETPCQTKTYYVTGGFAAAINSDKCYTYTIDWYIQMYNNSNDGFGHIIITTKSSDYYMDLISTYQNGNNYTYYYSIIEDDICWEKQQDCPRCIKIGIIFGTLFFVVACIIFIIMIKQYLKFKNKSNIDEIELNKNVYTTPVV